MTSSICHGSDHVFSVCSNHFFGWEKTRRNLFFYALKCLNDPVSDENFDDNDDTVGNERSTDQKLTFMDNFFLIFIIYIYAAIIINYVLSSDKEK